MQNLDDRLGKFVPLVKHRARHAGDEVARYKSRGGEARG